MQGGFLGLAKNLPFRPIGEDYPLVLASGSPRRKDLLMSLKIPFKTTQSDVDEENVIGEPFSQVVELSTRKAKKALEQELGHWILAADTIVILGRDVFGKPRDPYEAFKILSKLSAKTHFVITGFVILDPRGDLAHKEAVITEVSFKEITEKEIWDYIATGEPLDKAGAYGIQGIGAFLVKSIKGSYTNVVGLPCFEVISALISLGALSSFPLITSASGSQTV